MRIVDADEELITWRQGRSLPYGEGVALWSLGEIVKAQAGILESDGAQETGEKLAAMIGSLIADEADARWVERHLRRLTGIHDPAALAESGQEEGFAAWRRFVEALAEWRPTVLVFEDLHWADDGLLDFVDSLAERVSGVPLLVVCSARPELLERRPGWGGGKRNATTVSLVPLSDEDTTRLLGALLGSSVLLADTQLELLRRAGGNPLFAEEYARMQQTGAVRGARDPARDRDRPHRRASALGEGAAASGRGPRQGLLDRRPRRARARRAGVARRPPLRTGAEGVRPQGAALGRRRRAPVRLRPRARP